MKQLCKVWIKLLKSIKINYKADGPKWIEFFDDKLRIRRLKYLVFGYFIRILKINY